MKEKTIKYLQWQIDEIKNNLLAMKMSEEDYELNQQEIYELESCIEWVKGK
jgi:SMC interacting uncharacterized protein involved in chromosome segregation